MRNVLAFTEKCNYNVIMKTKIVKIGNSQGIRIPKIILEQSGLSEEVELIAEDAQIIIRSIRQIRADWDEAFKATAVAGEDVLLDKKFLIRQSSWDDEEWDWE